MGQKKMTRKSRDRSNWTASRSQKIVSVNLNYQPSSGWFSHFIKSYHLFVYKRTSVAQKLSANYEEKLINFQRYVIEIQKERGYNLAHIGNAD